MSDDTELRLDRFAAAADYFDRLTDLQVELDMSDWGPDRDDVCEHSVDEYVRCGTPACMAGWLAVSPDFLAAGGEVAPCLGLPMFNECRGAEAVAEFFGVDEWTADGMCETGGMGASEFYRVTDPNDIDTAVIAKRFRQIARNGKV